MVGKKKKKSIRHFYDDILHDYDGNWLSQW